MPTKKVNGQVEEGVETTEEVAPTSAAEVSPATEAPSTAEAELAERTRELQQAKDQLLRQVAEFQNYRRRTEKEKEQLFRRGQGQVIEQMLGVLDDFRRSLDASAQVEQQEEPGPAYQALKEGVELVYQNLSDVLRRLGAEPIEAVGRAFDENEHEAIMQQPAPEGVVAGTVLHEVQRGYRLGDRILRHARVIVAA